MSAEQAAQQGNQGGADQSHTAAGHQLIVSLAWYCSRKWSASSKPLFRRQQKAWQPVLLGTNCQPFFVVSAACRGTLLSENQGGTAPRSCRLLHKGITHETLVPTSCATKPRRGFFGFFRRKGPAQAGGAPRRKKPPPSGGRAGEKRVWSGVTTSRRGRTHCYRRSWRRRWRSPSCRC